MCLLPLELQSLITEPVMNISFCSLRKEFKEWYGFISFQFRNPHHSLNSFLNAQKLILIRGSVIRVKLSSEQGTNPYLPRMSRPIIEPFPC